MIYICVLLWIVCGVLTFGLMFAAFQREFRLLADMQQISDFKIASVGAVMGPVGLLTTLIWLQTTRIGFKHGFKYNLKPEGITWEQYKAEKGL